MLTVTRRSIDSSTKWERARHNGRQSVSQGFICEIINKRANTCDPTIEEYTYTPVESRKGIAGPGLQQQAQTQDA